MSAFSRLACITSLFAASAASEVVEEANLSWASNTPKSCGNNPFYKSPQQLSCDSYSALSCRTFGVIGFSELDVAELLHNCPESCSVECSSRRTSDVEIITRRRQQEDTESEACKNVDDPIYISPQGAPCVAYSGWDCTLFAIVGFTEYEVYDLVNSCAFSCGVPCGTFTLSPTPGPTNEPTISAEPSASPSASPSSKPSDAPSVQPSDVPSTMPSTKPSTSPSTSPSNRPSSSPSSNPSMSPSVSPSSTPTGQPSESPSSSPSSAPSDTPSLAPTTETEGLRTKVDRFQADVDNLSEDVQLLEDQNEDLEQELGELETKNQDLNRNVQTLEDASKIHKFMQKFLIQSYETCESSLMDKQEECASRIGETEAKFADMEKLYNELLSKTSGPGAGP